MLTWRRIDDYGAETGSPSLAKFNNERDNPLVGLAVWLVFSVRAQGEALRALAERMDRFDEHLRAVEVAIARLARISHRW